MRLTISVSTRNREKLLLETLHHIFYQQNLPLDDFEVIIVNDGDNDISYLNQKFPFPNLKTILNRGKGLAAGRNTGARAALSPVILFLDDDIIITPDHLIKHLKYQEENENWLVTANRFYTDELIMLAKKTSFGRYKIKYEYNWINGFAIKDSVPDKEGLYFTDLLAGFSFSMRKTTFKKVGGFSELFEFATCEDAEFFNRALEKNFKLVFDENNICFHNESDNFTLEKWLQRQSSGIKGGLVMVHLHPEGKSHPTFYLNEPIHASDSFHLKIQKMRRYALSNVIARKLIRVAIFSAEKIHLPDIFLFKLYNAAWIGETHHSFLQAYKEMFGEKKVE